MNIKCAVLCLDTAGEFQFFQANVPTSLSEIRRNEHLKAAMEMASQAGLDPIKAVDEESENFALTQKTGTINPYQFV